MTHRVRMDCYGHFFMDLSFPAKCSSLIKAVDHRSWVLTAKMFSDAVAEFVLFSKITRSGNSVHISKVTYTFLFADV